MKAGHHQTRAAILAVVAALLCSASSISVRAQDAFYSATPAQIVGQPGTIIRQEPMPGAPDGASAYKILYRSIGMDGKLIAVSGFVVIPEGGDVPGGRPIVAWAHPTTGVAPKCAPSLDKLAFATVQGLSEMIKLGYVIVATDYPGLGTPYTHPYLIGESEGRAVLDSVRAARTIPGTGHGNRFMAWGHSQGGQAALFAGLLAKQYAPELEAAGVAAAAPATDLTTLLRDDFNTRGGKSITAMALWSWARVFSAPIDKIVVPAEMDTVDHLAGECTGSLAGILEHLVTERPLQKSFLTVNDITTIEPWRSLAEVNSPGPLPASLPVFLAQGSADQVVRPTVTAGYMKELCGNGSAVRMLQVPGVGHAFIGRDSANAAVEWMRERFDARPAPNDCAD